MTVDDHDRAAPGRRLARARPAPDEKRPRTAGADAHAGREAQTPSDFGKRSWKQILLRVKREVAEDRVSLLAAGVAYYAILAIFPALIAAVSIYGLAFDAGDVAAQLQKLPAAIPAAVQETLREQLGALVEARHGGLTLALVLAIVVALWSASSGMQNLLQAIGIAYDQEETRSAVRRRLIALGATLGAIVVFLIAVVLLTVLPALLRSVGLDQATEITIGLLRWPLLAVLAIVALAALYRYGPDRDPAQWRWVSWGAVAATALWLVVSGAFSWYVANFGSYNRTYGSLGAVIVTMVWLWVTAFTVLLGAEINAEMEHQTARDTTRGRPQPMGERGAFVADHLPDRSE